MKFTEAVKQGFRRSGDTGGISSRSEFWYFTAFTTTVWWLWYWGFPRMQYELFGTYDGDTVGRRFRGVYILVVMLLTLVLLIPMWSAARRRLRDAEKSQRYLGLFLFSMALLPVLVVISLRLIYVPAVALLLLGVDLCGASKTSEQTQDQLPTEDPAILFQPPSLNPDSAHNNRLIEDLSD